LELGAHVVDANAGIALNGQTANLSSSKQFGVTAPLPDFGIWGGFALNNRMAITFDADYLSLTIGSIYGSIFTYDLVYFYGLSKHVGLSLGVTGLNFDVDATKKDVRGSFKWGYNGFSLNATYSFGNKSWESSS